MRKYMIGAIFGFMLSMAFGVQAQDVIQSIVGKQVQGQFPVRINGKQIDQPAAVVDGTSYLPVRVIGDTLNMDVQFNPDLGIELRNKGVAVVTTPQQNPNIFPDNPPLTPSDPLQDKLSDLVSEARKIDFDRFQLLSKMSVYENSGKEKDQVYHDLQKQVEEFNRQSSNLDPQILQLQKQLNK